MHNVIVTLKDGTVYKGPIKVFRPVFNYFIIWGSDGVEKKFCFDDCKSLITENERVSINSPIEGEPDDLMLKAKQSLDDGREHGWREDGKDYPLEHFNWGKKYE